MTNIKSWLKFYYIQECVRQPLPKFDLGYVMCENCFNVNGRSAKSGFDKCMTLQKPPVVFIILLQITHYH